MSKVLIETKVLDRKKKLLDDWSVDLPPGLNDDGDNITLRDLITRVVISTVEDFGKRQEDNRFVRALSADQIQEGLEKGKVDTGGRDLGQEVDADIAVGTALQAFEDGMYLVIIDGTECKTLDQEVFLKPDSKITFIRLIFLAGG